MEVRNRIVRIIAIALTGSQIAICTAVSAQDLSQHVHEIGDPISLSSIASNPDQAIISFSRLTPFVVDVAREESMTLEIGVTDSTVVSLDVESRASPLSELGPIHLVDDGTNGDKQAGDRVFTATGLVLSKRTAPDWRGESYPRMTAWTTGPTAVTWNPDSGEKVRITYEDGHVRDVTLHVLPPGGAINTNYVDIPDIVELAPDTYASGYVLNVVTNDEDVPHPYYYDVGTRYNLHDVSRRALKYVDDTYDWMIVQDLSGNAQAYYPVARREEGVFDVRFDDSNAYGSNFVLRGIIYDDLGWELAHNPPWSGNYGLYFKVLQHEMLHTWASFVPEELELRSDGGHWDAVEKSSTCFGGYGIYRSIELDSGLDRYEVSYPPGGSNIVCNDLELYLMGLLPIEELSDTKTLVNPGKIEVIDGKLYLDADSLRVVKPVDVIDVLGHRVPSVENAPKHFGALMVVVHDRPLTAVEMALFDFRMREWEKPDSEVGLSFSEVVGGRATVSTRVQVRGNNAPVVAGVIPDVELHVGGESYTHDLSTIFSDPDGDVLRFEAATGAASVATAAVSNDTLTVTPQSTGATNITVRAIDIWGHAASTSFTVNVPTGVAVDHVGVEIPVHFALKQNYPNPFNPVTAIGFDLPQPCRVTLKLYDILGHEIAVLVRGEFPTGHFETEWDASSLPTGVYMYRLEAGAYTAARKLVLQK